MAEEKKLHTISEYLDLISEKYAAYKDTIHASICGLAEYASVLAAAGRKDELADLRRFTHEMADFWFSADDSSDRKWSRYEERLNQACAAARKSGQAPVLSHETRKDVLAGLGLYAQEMEDTGDMEDFVRECNLFAAKLRGEWLAQDITVDGKVEHPLVIAFANQNAGRKHYDLDELQKLIDPAYEIVKAKIHQCICGLTEYAGFLTAAGREDELPDLCRFTRDMTYFWFPWEEAEGDGDRSWKRHEERINAASAAARESGQAPDLSPEALQDILNGLDLYAQEMEFSGGMEDDVDECNIFAARLQADWPAQNMTMGGM